MAEYIEIPGDLFQAEVDVLGHGCNMQGVMGAGVARIVREKWPLVYQDYRRLCLAQQVELGGFNMYAVEGGLGWVANLYTQRLPGPHASLAAVAASVTALVESMQTKTAMRSLALPRIGAGIGGLEWTDVQAILKNIAKDNEVDITVYVL